MTAHDAAQRPAGRLNLRLIVCIVLSFCLTMPIIARFYWPAGHGRDVTHQQIGRDFINTWAGTRVAWSGHVSTLFDLQGYVRAISVQFGQPLEFHNWGYPPFTLILFWPLAQLPYFWALGVWTVALFAFYAFVGTRFVQPNKRWMMVVALLAAPACLINTVGGQNGFVTAALLIGGVLCLDRRPLLAGVLFGLLTLKPQLGLALPLVLIVLRAWKTILAACVTTALLVMASVAAFGVEPWVRFLTETSAYQIHLLQDFHGFYPYMMTSVLSELRILHTSYDVAFAIQVCISLIVAAATAWAVSRTPDPRLRACVIAAATPLITPYAFNYDLTAITICITWRLLEPSAQDGSNTRTLLCAAWLAPAWLMISNMAGLPLSPLALAPLFGLSVLWAVRDGRSRRGPAPALAAGELSPVHA